MQRSVILKIIRPYDESIKWEDVGYLWRGLSFKVCKISNYCMTHHLLRVLGLETENLNPQGHLYCYPRLAQEYPEVPAGIICAAEGRARKVFRQNAKGVLYSETALPSFRKDCSIPIPVAGYSLLKAGADTYVASIQFLSRQGAKTQKLPGRIRLVLANNWRDKSAGRVLQQLAEGTLKRGIASLYRRKRDWYLSIPYETEAPEPEGGFEPGLAMGVAFGLHCALSYAFNNLLKRGEMGGDEVLSHQEKLLARRKQIQEQFNWSGRKGHGRENALKPIRSLYEKERNYRNLTNERYAKWVVEIAKKNRCGTIRLEAGNAGRNGTQRILLANWPREALRKKIRNKAEAFGIEVVECADAQIRNRCSHCGKEREPEKEKRMFVCKDCGYGTADKNRRGGSITVDYNTARNLAVYKSEGKEL